jgi:hypothetical protein
MNCGDRFYDENVVGSIYGSDIGEDVDIIYGNTVHSTNSTMRPYKALQLNRLRFYMPFCHQSSFVRSSIIKKHKFDLRYKIAADYNLFYHLYQDGAGFKYINTDIAIYELNGVSETNSKIRENEYRQIQNKDICLCRFYYEVLKKRFYYDLKNRLKYVKIFVP